MKLVRETFTAASASNILLPQKRDREGLPSQTNDVLILVIKFLSTPLIRVLYYRVSQTVVVFCDQYQRR